MNEVAELPGHERWSALLPRLTEMHVVGTLADGLCGQSAACQALTITPWMRTPSRRAKSKAFTGRHHPHSATPTRAQLLSLNGKLSDWLSAHSYPAACSSGQTFASSTTHSTPSSSCSSSQSSPSSAAASSPLTLPAHSSTLLHLAFNPSTAGVCLPTEPVPLQAQGYLEVEQWTEGASTARLGRAVWSAVSVKQRSVPPVLPFPFIGEVADELERCRGCTLWAVPRVELPESMGSGHHGPKHWSSVMATPLQVDRLSLQLVSLPCHDEVLDARKSITELDSSLVVPPRQLRSEAAFWHRVEHPEDGSFGRITGLYARDIEDRDVWGPISAPAKSAVYQADHGATRHYLNTNLFTRHPSNLFSLLKGTTWAWSGVSSPSYYLKLYHSFFKAHCEQSFFPSYNFCWEGSSIWYLVQPQHRHLLDRFIAAKAVELYRLEQARERLSAEEARLLPLLLYTRQWWFSPRQLVAHGVPVHRVLQRPGEVVLLDGHVVHWGMVEDTERPPYCKQEAINFCPESWLFSGLQQLQLYLVELRAYIELEAESTHRAFHKLMYDPFVKRMLVHHAPRSATMDLLEAIAHDLGGEAHARTPTFHYSPSTLRDRVSIVDSIRQVLAHFDDQQVEALYAEVDG